MSGIKRQNTTKSNNIKGISPLQMKRQSEIDKYFKGLLANHISPKSKLFTQKELQRCEKGTERGIRKGNIPVKEEPSNLDSILIKQKIDDELIKAEELKRKRDEILKAIERLDMRMNKSSSVKGKISATNKTLAHPELLNYKPNSIFTREEHEDLVQKILKAQEHQDKRNEEILYNLQKKYEQEEKRIKEAEAQKFNTEKQLRKMRSENNLAARRQKLEQSRFDQMKANKELLNLKHKSFLHQVMEEKFNKSVVLPTLQEKKKKLKEIREISKAFDVKKIDEHEKKYLKERNRSMHQLHAKSRVGDEWIYKPPEKPEKLTKILEVEITDKKKQLAKHHKEIEEKLIRQENYVRLLKQKHKPIVNNSLKQEMDTRLEKIHTRKRETTIEPRQAGLQNLSKAKKMKKQNSELAIGSQSHIQESYSPERSRVINYLKIKDDDNYYSQKRKEQLEKLLKEEEMPLSEKEKKLKMENEKIEQALRRKEQLLKVDNRSIETRKETADLLLSGIKAKIGLIQLAE